MAIFERLGRWLQSRDALNEEVRRAMAARRATLDGLSLEQADRAFALLIERPAVWPPRAVPDAGGLDRYTAAFVQQNDEVGFGDDHGDGWIEIRADGGALQDTGLLVVGLGRFDELYGTRPGSAEVFARARRGALESVGASFAHLGLHVILSDEELTALAAAPDDWEPDPELRPSALEVARRALFATRPAGGVSAELISAAALVAGLGFLWVALGLFDRSIVGAGIALVIGGVALRWSTRLLREAIWLEPAARQLDIDHAGMRDPTTGKRLSWADVRKIERAFRSVIITLPDGRRVDLPTSLWFEPEATFAWMVQKSAKRPQRPYR